MLVEIGVIVRRGEVRIGMVPHKLHHLFNRMRVKNIIILSDIDQVGGVLSVKNLDLLRKRSAVPRFREPDEHEILWCEQRCE